jgi:aromatic ring hydroxylase
MTIEAIEQKVNDFKDEIIQEIGTTTEEYRNKIATKEYNKGLESPNKQLDQYLNFKVTKENSDEAIKLFKLIEAFKGNENGGRGKWDPRQIKATGQQFGFDMDSTFSVYYLVKHAEAYDKIMSKKNDLYSVVTGVNL